MNASARHHLVKAKEYLARGEQFYHLAAEQILAAKNEGATWVEIGDDLGHSDEWAKRIVSWHKTPANDDTYTLPFSEPQGMVAKRHARAVLRDAEPEELREIMQELPVERRAAVVRAAVPPPERTSSGRTDASFIELIVRVNSALIELEALVASWQNPAAIPDEFSRDSFNDIVAKVDRIRRHFDQVEETRDDEDEFQKIVRNFRVVADGVS